MVGEGRDAGDREVDAGDGRAADGVDGWAAEQRVERAARDRSARTWHGRVAVEEATFRGVLSGLGARGRAVVLERSGGRRHRGWVRLVGDDVVVLRTAAGPAGTDVVLALAAVTAVRPAPGGDQEVGAQAVTATTTLATVLAPLAESGIDVAVTTDGGDPVLGEIDGVGDDVLRVRLRGGAGTVYVRLGSVLEVSVPESG